MQPVARSERYVPIDILRGLALYGVLFVNLQTLFRVSLFSHMTGQAGATEPISGTIEFLYGLLLESKAFTLFSFLFGVGIAIQTERARQREANPWRFLLRRFTVLLAIGLIHLILIWDGDILTLYAVCGILSLAVLRAPARILAIVGVLLIAYSTVSPLGVDFSDSDLTAWATKATRIYATGTYIQILALRIEELRLWMVPLLIATLPKTLGVILLGVASWRTGLLTNRARLWKPAFFFLASIGLLAARLDAELPEMLALCGAYTAAVLLWLSRAPLLQAAGQMAFTNYLTQSLVFTFAFYGYGLGAFGKLTITQTAVLATAFYALQLFVSRWWLNRFQFGPAEWIWRSLTYGERQPMLRDSPSSRSRSVAATR